MVTLKIFSFKTVLFQAGDVDTVRALLDTGVQVDVKGQGQDQGTPLYWASRGTKAGADMIRLLLSRGAAIESPDSYKSTPLLLAAYVSLIFLFLALKISYLLLFPRTLL